MEEGIGIFLFEFILFIIEFGPHKNNSSWPKLEWAAFLHPFWPICERIKKLPVLLASGMKDKADSGFLLKMVSRENLDGGSPRRA
jgi:hypothetical protein